MKLITEFTEGVKYLTEAKEDGTKSYFIEGVFAQGNVKNRNGRIYPTDVLSNEVSRYVRESVNTKRAFGELNHPQTCSVNLERASHLITSLVQEGDNFIGKAKILDTPVGKIVKVLLDEGASIGVSTRGLGSIKERNGISEVQGDFRLSTVDIVADPSAPDAFVRGIMESKEWVFVDGRYVEQDIDHAKSIIRESKKSEAAMIAVFEDFVKKIARC
jgi:hypothetical protein